MKHAIIQEGKVINVVVATPEFATDQGWVPAPAEVNPGWAYDGTTFTDVEALTPAEALQAQREALVVTMRQARLALNASGHLASIPALMDAMAEPDKSNFQIEWEYSTTVERLDPWVINMGTALGLSDTQIDDLFMLAITL